ncbi:hypothetical protein MMC14_001862, partial [Varicellaria rhodocarpa]|nr:hypothetical protein [Varicellaria rhodocarpa]
VDDEFNVVDNRHNGFRDGRQVLQDTANALQRGGEMREVNAVQEPREANDGLGGSVEAIKNSTPDVFARLMLLLNILKTRDIVGMAELMLQNRVRERS